MTEKQTQQPISVDAYLKMFEENCQNFQNDFEDICDDKMTKYLVGKFCENQIQYTKVLRDTFSALGDVATDPLESKNKK